MIFLNEHNLLACFDWDDLRQCMEGALRAISNGTSSNYPRTAFNLDNRGQKALGFMPATDSINNLLGYKTVSVFHENLQKGINPHQGLVVLLDYKTGLVKALLDGSFITAVRTAAVSAVATECLSRENSNALALIGAGRQAIEHEKSIARIRPIDTLFVYARSTQSFNHFVEQLDDSSYKIFHKKNPIDAIEKADIVVTCTSATSALFSVHDLREGTHVNAVGACRPGFSEIDLYNRENLNIYLDSKQSCFLESEEIINALSRGQLAEEHIVGELGAYLNDDKTCRTNSLEITLFKSVGVSIEDVYAAEYFYQNALSKQIGQKIT